MDCMSIEVSGSYSGIYRCYLKGYLSLALGRLPSIGSTSEQCIFFPDVWQSPVSIFKWSKHEPTVELGCNYRFYQRVNFVLGLTKTAVKQVDEGTMIQRFKAVLSGTAMCIVHSPVHMQHWQYMGWILVSNTAVLVASPSSVSKLSSTSMVDQC